MRQVRFTCSACFPTLMILVALVACGPSSRRTVDLRSNGDRNNLGADGFGKLSKRNLPVGGLRRLTRSQYLNSVRDVLGDVTLKTQIEPDVPFLALSNLGAATVTTTPRGVELYEAAANELAAQVFADAQKTNTFVGCQVDTTNGYIDACVENFIKKVGRLAWRRPPSTEEMSSLKKVHLIVASDLKSATKGLEAVTVAILSSPKFLYRSEVGAVIAGGIRALDAYEIAARLSYLLWDSTPDSALLDAAEQGKLADANGVKSEAQRLLANPRSKEALLRFFREWLGFDALATLGKNQMAYPQFTPTLAAAMQSELDHVLDRLVFTSGQNFTQLLNRSWTYVNPELASLYGLQPASSEAHSMTLVEIPTTSPRGGLLTMAGLLASQAKPDTTAPISRGRYVLNRLLCEIVPAPPPDIPALPPDVADGSFRTQRQRLDIHTASPGCASCHIKMDAAGLALEQFDGVGAYRDSDRGLPLDVSGALDEKKFTGAKELGALLQNKTEVHQCIVKHLYRHALGAIDDERAMLFVKDLTSQFSASGFDYQTLILNLVTSDNFKHVGEIR
ncbi:MAG: DUF1592 domain-containing protein [Proteobacteria bacterium]|nr:DUF1592 domain-containing protein [Pseudomonadota bacterium]